MANKKIVILLIVLCLSTVTLFARNSTPESMDGSVGVREEYTIGSTDIPIKPTLGGYTRRVTNPFAQCWQFYLKIVIGVIGGSLMLLRFAVELTGAIIYEGEDSSSKVRQAIIRLLVHVGVAVVGFALISILVF